MNYGIHNVNANDLTRCGCSYSYNPIIHMIHAYTMELRNVVRFRTMVPAPWLIPVTPVETHGRASLRPPRPSAPNVRHNRPFPTSPPTAVRPPRPTMCLRFIHRASPSHRMVRCLVIYMHVLSIILSVPHPSFKYHIIKLSTHNSII